MEHGGEVPDTENPQFLEVERFSVTEEGLKLNYRVTNIFPHDIWVCTSLSSFASEGHPHTVETRITNGALRIRRRGNLEQNMFVDEGAVYAVYHRLLPRQSRSGTVLLPLPVRNNSPVYEAHEPFSQVVLNRAALELGYFREDLLTLLLQSKERGWLYVRTNFTSAKRDPNVAYVRYIKPNKWEGLALEQSVQIIISDVTVPGVRGGTWERLANGVMPYMSPGKGVKD